MIHDKSYWVSRAEDRHQANEWMDLVARQNTGTAYQDKNLRTFVRAYPLASPASRDPAAKTFWESRTHLDHFLELVGDDSEAMGVEAVRYILWRCVTHSAHADKRANAQRILDRYEGRWSSGNVKPPVCINGTAWCQLGHSHSSKECVELFECWECEYRFPHDRSQHSKNPTSNTQQKEGKKMFRAVSVAAFGGYRGQITRSDNGEIVWESEVVTEGITDNGVQVKSAAEVAQEEAQAKLSETMVDLFNPSTAKAKKS